MSEDEQRARIMYAGGLGHGALMAIRDCLIARDYEKATRLAGQSLAQIERIISPKDCQPGAMKRPN